MDSKYKLSLNKVIEQMNSDSNLSECQSLTLLGYY